MKNLLRGHLFGGVKTREKKKQTKSARKAREPEAIRGLCQEVNNFLLD